MKTGIFKTLHTVYVISLLASLTSTVNSANAANNQSFFGTEVLTDYSTDPTKPVARGYIEPKVEAIPGGARLHVDLYFLALNSGVTLVLQAAINDGNGGTTVIPLKVLSNNVSDNPTLYHSRRTFDLTYAELNQIISQAAPNAKNLKIEAGTPLFVYALFETGHQWGGVARGGIFFMPEDKSQAAPQTLAVNASAVARPLELDIAYPITQSMALAYSTVKKEDIITKYGARTYSTPGLVTSGPKVGGQIRSRTEAEGKFQVSLAQAAAVKKALFELANDPAKATALLGPDWTLTLESRYLQKDAAGKALMGADGYPIPDPMVDTYYDNDTFDAAKKDMAIRWRYTAGNNSGAWNMKPGVYRLSPEGLVYRVEYALDATDEKPGTIAKFVDSNHPLNFFKTIRERIPGATPSKFLKPSVKLTDHRYKFMLKHKTGLAIEVSLDEVLAQSLRGKQGKGSGRFVQIEMDVDHLALKSMNVVQNAAATFGVGTDIGAFASVLKTLDDKAFCDGRPVLHDARDLDPSSPIQVTHAADFQLASIAIAALRTHTLGDHWLPAPQKYAYAAATLGVIQAKDISPSVLKLREVRTEKIKLGAPQEKLFAPFGLTRCGFVFN